MSEIAEEKREPSLNSKVNDWWSVLKCLPIALVVQIVLLATPSKESAAMAKAAMWIDAVVLLRGIAGLIWQPRSRNWRLYCILPFAGIPLMALCELAWILWFRLRWGTW